MSSSIHTAGLAVTWVLAGVLASMFPGSPAAARPALHVSEDIALDPGSRYHDWLRAFACRIRQRGDTLGFFGSTTYDSGFRSYFGSFLGDSFWPERSLRAGDGTVHDVLWEADHLLSIEIQRDTLSIARYSANRPGPAERSTTLWTDSTPGDPLSTTALIAPLAGGYVAAWAIRDLGVAYVSRDLDVVEIFHAPISSPVLALAANERGALVAWPGDDDLGVRILGETAGSKSGDVRIPATLPVQRMAAAPIDSGWLLAWTEGYPTTDLRWVVLDDRGVPSTDVQRLANAPAAGGLALAASPTGALLAFRSLGDLFGTGALYCQRIGVDGIPIAESFRLARPLSEWEHRLYHGQIDVAWTGSDYLVAWVEYIPPSLSLGCEDWWLDTLLGIRAHRVSPDGVVREQDPAAVNRVYEMRSAWPRASPGGFDILMRDRDSETFQQMRYDLANGTLSVRPERTIVADLDQCDYGMFGGPVCNGPQAQFAVYGFVAYHWDYDDYCSIRVDRVDEMGEWTRFRDVQGVASASMAIVDAAADSNAVWYVTRTSFDAEADMALSRTSGSGQRVSSWRFQIAPYSYWNIAVGAVGTGAVLLWVGRGGDGGQHLMTTAVHEGDPSPLTPRRLFTTFDPKGTRARIARGAGGGLAVLRVADPTAPATATIYAVRFDATGRPLDDPPIRLSEPGSLGEIGVVWDGSAYVVVWTDRDQGSFVARRVVSSGSVIDPAPVTLFSGDGRFQLAAGDDGATAVCYGNHLRIATLGAPPELLSDLRAVEVEEGIEISWTTRFPEQLESFDVLRITADAVDTRVNSEPIPPASGTLAITDLEGDASIHEYAVLGYFRSGGSIRSGPAVPVRLPDQPDYALSLAVRPNPAETSFVLELTIPHQTTRVTLRLFDAAGRQLVAETLEDLLPGPNVLSWPRNALALGSGVYWVQLEAGDEIKKATSLRIIR